MSIRSILASHHKKRVLDSATLDRASNPEVADVLENNICTIAEMRRAEEKAKSRQDRISDLITDFSGDLKFVYIHAAWFGVWMAINLGWTPMKPFDPYPFGLLTMVVSLEAIFLSTFVLVSQNRMSEAADKRADLDLQINLLAEYEITRILRLVDAMAEKMGIDEAFDPAIDDLKTTTAPDIVLQEIQKRAKEAKKL